MNVPLHAGSMLSLHGLRSAAVELQQLIDVGWQADDRLEGPTLIRRNDPTPADAYRRLPFPVLILRGEYAPSPTRTIAEGLAELLPASRLVVVASAGHMGPLTHAIEVSALVVRHIADAESQADAPLYRAAQRDDMAGFAMQRAGAAS